MNIAMTMAGDVGGSHQAVCVWSDDIYGCVMCVQWSGESDVGGVVIGVRVEW